MGEKAAKEATVEREGELAMRLGGRHLADYGSARSRHDFRQRQFDTAGVGVHHLRGASALKGQRRDQPAVLGGRNDAGPFPALPCHRFINPFTSWGATVFPIQPVIHAALVEVIHAGGRQLSSPHLAKYTANVIVNCYSVVGQSKLKSVAGGRETLKEKLKPYLKTGDWTE